MATKVCVTGASGFVATHCVQQLLEDGYYVKATVRDPTDEKKVSFLKRIAAEANAEDRLELVKGELLEENSFDDAVKDCEYVLHTASPFFITSDGDPDETFIRPAVKGTENVLNSVAKSSTVKRVILTSSCAAIYGSNDDKEGVFTEEDWNRTSDRKNGAYSLSKRMAEERAWEMAKAQDQYQLITINPAFVMGPTLSGRGTASYDFVKKIVDGSMKPYCPHLVVGMVDVRDVAKAHIKAMTHPNAQGRYIVAPESLTPLDVANILKEKFPNFSYPSGYAPKWLLYIFGPMMGVSWHFVSHNMNVDIKFDVSKIKKELDFEFRPISQALLDMVEAGIESGILKPKKK